MRVVVMVPAIAIAIGLSGCTFETYKIVSGEQVAKDAADGARATGGPAA